MPLAIALSGGGSKGDFEIGAVRALYNRGVQPDIVTGTSVGSVNAVKLAEDAIGDGALSELEEIWLDLMGDGDMYVEDPKFAELSQAVRNLIRYGRSQLADGPVSFITDPFVGLLQFADVAAFSSAELIDGVEAFLKAKSKSLYLFRPLREKLQIYVDPAKVMRSGVKLRMAAVSLESGEVRYVDERGRFTDDDTPVNLLDAAIASSSIPAIFAPQRLGSENFIDGGVRDVLPVQVALDAGADQVYAIVASRGGVDSVPKGSFDEKTIVDIALRATMEIMPDQLQRFETSPPGLGWSKNVMFIQPDFTVHDSLTVDPGLIRINRDFGYMRAADIFNYGQPADFIAVLVLAILVYLSTHIAELRKEIWTREYAAAGQRTLGQEVLDPVLVLVPSPEAFLEVREMKKELKKLLEERMALFGAVPTARVWPTTIDFGEVAVCRPQTRFITVRNMADFGTPPDVSQLWLQFEAHPWTNPAAGSPWGSFHSVAGEVPAETPPAPAALPSADLQLGLAQFPGVFTASLPVDVVPPGQSVAIPVQFTPAPGPNQATLTVYTSDSTQQAIEIHLSGLGVDAVAAIKVFPTTVSFGVVFVGMTRRRSATITNTGCQPLTVTAISTTDIFTALPPSLPLSIAPGALVSVPIEFQPEISGTSKGIMSITSDAESAPTKIQLVGTGRELEPHPRP